MAATFGLSPDQVRGLSYQEWLLFRAYLDAR